MNVRRIAATLLLVGCFATAPTVSAQTVTLIHVNDTHSHLDSGGLKDANLDGTVGGMQKAASVIGMLKMTEPNPLLLHAGDVSHGDLMFQTYFGVPEYLLMQQLGFDAMTVGNHEFDFGPGTFAYALSQATENGMTNLPFLGANIDYSAVPELGNWIQGSVIKDYNGLKVGIFGLTTPSDPMSMPDPVKILGEDPEVLMGLAAQKMMELRGAGCQVVILLSHLGWLYDEAVAANIPGIDIIVGGHDHYLFTEPKVVPNPYGQPVYVVQAGNHYLNVGKMTFTFDGAGVVMNDYQIIPVDKNVPAAEEVKQFVDVLKYVGLDGAGGVVGQFGDVYHKRLSYALADIKMSYDPQHQARDTGMGNLITDAYRWKTHTDLGITPNGLISEGISRGWVVGADVFRPVSYGYDTATGLGLNIATFEISGMELVKSLEVGLAYYGLNEDFFLQGSGFKFKFDPTKPIGERVDLASLRINGKALNPAKLYSCTVNSGVVALLPLMGVTVSNVQVLADLEYNVLKDYIKRAPLVYSGPEGRMRDTSVAQQ